MTTVAILGTGRMGSAMARALVRGGHSVVLYNRTGERAQALADEVGGRVAATPAEAVRQADVAITMLADGSAVEETYRQSDGALAGVHDGVVLLEMSTAEPHVAQSLAPEVAQRGGTLLDAPVSGSVALAEQGKLTVMVGGDEAAMRRTRPVLDSLAARVFHIGPVGTGAAMKLAVNAVIFALDVAISEALVLAERAGIDRERAYEVLEASAAGAPFVTYKKQAFVDPATAPVAFSLELAAKDLRLIEGLAQSVRLPLAQVRTNAGLIEEAARTQGAERDFALVAVHLRDSG